MKRPVVALRATCGLSAALVLLPGLAHGATPPAPKCEFFSFHAPDPNAKAVVRENFAFLLTLTHPDSVYFGQTVSVSATVDWGDGTVETTAPRSFGHGFGTPYFEGKVEHAYARTGTFVVKILRGTVNGQSCPLGDFKQWEAGFGATPKVTVVEGAAQAKVVHAVPSSGAAALAQKKLVALPTPTPASAAATSRKSKALVPTPTPVAVKTYSISK
jgi:hypothetical protein